MRSSGRCRPGTSCKRLWNKLGILAKDGGRALLPSAGCAAPAQSPTPSQPHALRSGRPRLPYAAAGPAHNALRGQRSRRLPPGRPGCPRSGAAAAPHRAAIGQRVCWFYLLACHWLPAAVTVRPASSGRKPCFHWASRGAARRIVRGLAVRAVRLRSNQAAGHGAPVSTSVRGSGAGVPARAPWTPRSAASPPPPPAGRGRKGAGRALPPAVPPARLCEAAAAAGNRRRHFGCGGQCRAATACRDTVATWGRAGGKRRRGNVAGSAGGGDGTAAAPGAGRGWGRRPPLRPAGADTRGGAHGAGTRGPTWQRPPRAAGSSGAGAGAGPERAAGWALHLHTIRSPCPRGLLPAVGVGRRFLAYGQLMAVAGKSSEPA